MATETSTSTSTSKDTKDTKETVPDDKPKSEKLAEKQAAEKFADVPKVDAKTIEAIQKDPRFAVPGRTVTTAEDAYYAFLREEITEEEMRAVVAMNGGSPFYALKGNLERPDNAYVRSVPEDLYDDPSIAVTTVEERLEVVKAKQEEAEEAAKQAELEREVATSKA